MEDEYIIINKTALEKRIEELTTNNLVLTAIKDELLKILSQSTPLIPEIEKAFDEGVYYGKDFINDEIVEKEKQEYTSNLKLDI